MKKLKMSPMYVLVLMVMASACKKEEEVPKGEYALGVVVVNEGNFSDSDGSFSFYNKNTGMASQDIYKIANDEKVAGVFQSITTYDGKSYLIDQAGSKIVVVASETFKEVTTLFEGLNVPRYMVVANGKGYISNWGPFDANFQTPNSFISVYDLETFELVKKINTDNGVEGMLVIGDQVYAAASGGNKVHIIDAGLDEIVGGYEVPVGPKGFTQDGNGRLWVLCNNFITSNLAKIDLPTNRVLATFEIESGATSIATNANGSNIFYLSAPWGAPSSVYKIDNSATFAPQEAFISGESFYGLGIDPEDDIIYIGVSSADANGTIVRYNTDGKELDNFPAGRFPNGFEFRK